MGKLQTCRWGRLAGPCGGFVADGGRDRLLEEDASALGFGDLRGCCAPPGRLGAARGPRRDASMARQAPEMATGSARVCVRRNSLRARTRFSSGGSPCRLALGTPAGHVLAGAGSCRRWVSAITCKARLSWRSPARYAAVVGAPTGGGLQRGDRGQHPEGGLAADPSRMRPADQWLDGGQRADTELAEQETGCGGDQPLQLGLCWAASASSSGCVGRSRASPAP
jgi:hypothetical protein